MKKIFILSCLMLTMLTITSQTYTWTNAGLDNDFENYLPEIQKIRGYKKVKTREDFLDLSQEKQESLIRKLCKS